MTDKDKLNQRAEDITDAVIRLLEGETEFNAQVYTMRIDAETPVHTPAVVVVFSNKGENQPKLLHVFMLDRDTPSVPFDFHGRTLMLYRNASAAFDHDYFEEVMKQVGVRHHSMIRSGELLFETAQAIQAKVDDVTMIDDTLIAEGLDLEKEFPIVFKNAILGILPVLARIK